jgi:hypothetical protein
MGKLLPILTRTQDLLKKGGRTIAISNGRLRGDQIRFNAGDSEYSGSVSGKGIQGSVKSGGNTAPWTAVLRSTQN